MNYFDLKQTRVFLCWDGKKNVFFFITRYNQKNSLVIYSVPPLILFVLFLATLFALLRVSPNARNHSIPFFKIREIVWIKFHSFFEAWHRGVILIKRQVSWLLVEFLTGAEMVAVGCSTFRFCFLSWPALAATRDDAIFFPVRLPRTKIRLLEPKD